MTGNNPRHFDTTIWERFFEFVAPNDGGLSRTQVQDELRRAGIDVRPAITRIHQALQTVKARQALAANHERRLRLTEKIKSILVEPIENVRQFVRDLIANKVPQKQQSAYFHKLEGAASEADLNSLLEDIQRLDAFECGELDDAP